MRLLNQGRSIGWAGKRIEENHEYPIIVGIATGVLILSMLLREKVRWTRQYLDWETLFVFVAILTPGLVILFYQCDKASLLPHSPGVFDEPFGCCSQALILPMKNIPLVIGYMQEQKRGQFDLMLDQLAVEVGYSRWALYPVQAQHIGKSSFLGFCSRSNTPRLGVSTDDRARRSSSHLECGFRRFETRGAEG